MPPLWEERSDKFIKTVMTKDPVPILLNLKKPGTLFEIPSLRYDLKIMSRVQKKITF